MTLAIYYYEQSEAYFVAESPEHAFDLLIESGLLDEDAATIEDLKRQRDDANFTIYMTDEEDEDGEHPRVTKTCREWCESNGPGFLCGPMD